MTGLWTKVGILFLVAGLMAAGMVVVFGNIRIEDSSDYKALFHDVSGLVPGSDVRAAGVTVGRVDDVTLQPDNQILVSFTASENVPLGKGTRAAVRYKNLVGDRYLELSDGPGGAGRLAPDDVIAADHTSPALDLDELYNGFTPLLQGLDPEQVNTLSSALIGVFQGEGPALEELLGSIGSLTGTVADRDRTIGTLIDNTNAVLATLNERSPELTNLVDRLQGLVSGLSADRQRIGDSIVRIGDLTGNVGSLLAQARPDLKGTITEVDRLSGLINSDRDTVQTTLSRLPESYRQLGRLGSYGGFFQFYICSVQLRMDGPTGPILTPYVSSGVERCQ